MLALKGSPVLIAHSVSVFGMKTCRHSQLALLCSYAPFATSSGRCDNGTAWAAKSRSSDNFGSDSAHRKVECSGNGICDANLGRCSCFPGFEGVACQTSKLRWCADLAGVQFPHPSSAALKHSGLSQRLLGAGFLYLSYDSRTAVWTRWWPTGHGWCRARLRGGLTVQRSLGRLSHESVRL